MKITHLKVNHLVNPMGYDLKRQVFLMWQKKLPENIRQKRR